MVNRLNDYQFKEGALRGESIGKAVGDIMRLSTGLEYLKYVLVLYNTTNWLRTSLSHHVTSPYLLYMLYTSTSSNLCTCILHASLFVYTWMYVCSLTHSNNKGADTALFLVCVFVTVLAVTVLVMKVQELLLMVWRIVPVCSHYSELQYSCQ